MGHEPTVVERALIVRATRAALICELLDQKIIAAGGDMSEHAANRLIAMANLLRRTLLALNVKPAAAAPPSPSLAEYLASKSKAAPP